MSLVYAKYAVFLNYETSILLKEETDFIEPQLNTKSEIFVI